MGAIISTGRGTICLWVGTKIFWGRQRVGPVFFSVGQRGDQIFFHQSHRWDLVIYVRGCCFTGDQTFFAHAKVGPEYFCACKGGTTKKWQAAITDRPPPHLHYFCVLVGFYFCNMCDIVIVACQLRRVSKKHQSVLMFTWVMSC